MPSAGPRRVIDYDRGDYDYQTFWRGRDYERWAERHALRRLLRQAGHASWTVDFGAGFGRNAEHYLDRSENVVLVDYAMGNLQRAAERVGSAPRRGTVGLVRADLYRLPFVDAAFDLGMVVRVLHHLPDIEAALAEMGRTLSRRWIVDVPIKHHLLAQVRGVVRRDRSQVRGPDPVSVTTTSEPFVNFRLDVVVDALAAQGWNVHRAASVNNFRRWDQVVPDRLVPALSPVVHALEAVAQPVGRGWWGPSQFLMLDRADRTRPVAPAGVLTPLAGIMVCPVCRTRLEWTAATAHCGSCGRTYSRIGAVWDMVPALPPPVGV